jgi:hypothetical protein
MKRPAPLSKVVDEKIWLLYDFCILKRSRQHRHDSREGMVRQLLNGCCTEAQIDRIMHSIIMGTYDLNDILANGIQK